MTLQKIEFEYDIPDGYRFVRYGEPKTKEKFINNGVICTAKDIFYGDKIIVEKIPEQEQPEQNLKRHKHADLIHAWAEGAEIQFIDNYGHWMDIKNPMFNNENIYRIKPKTKTIRFRNYIDRYFGTVKVARNGVPSDLGEWLGDWHEVEIEENE